MSVDQDSDKVNANGDNSNNSLNESTVEIRLLDRDNVKRYLVDLLKLEEITCKKLGKSYAVNPWQEKHFMHDLEGKWDYSFFALDVALDRLIGFLICSKYLDSVHGHRMIVDKDYRGLQVARRFFDLVNDKAKSSGLKYYTTTVPYTNLATKEWYIRHGFQLLEDYNQLKWFIKRKGKSAVVKEGTLVINQERCWVFRRDYNEM